MNSKKIRLMLWAVILVLIAGIAALGITLYNRMKPVDGSEVIAGVEWYDQNEKEFVITTADEMYDLATLSQFCDFKGQTIKLGADIVFNEGNAEDWAENAPERNWDAINGFSGTFDGQGHTISGLYSKGYDNNAGLFKNPTNVAVIQDFKIVNTYMESVGASGLGSVASGMQVGGTFRKIYSEAILVSDSDNVGGISGEIKKDATIEECWFNGKIDSSGWCLGGIIGEARSTKKLKVSHCLVTGEINSTYQGPNKYEVSRVGGIIGYLRQTGSPVAVFDDCFVDAKLEAVTEKPMASVAAYLDIKTTTTFSNMYATKETHAQTYTKPNATNVTITGAVLSYDQERMTGEKAYQWSTLDFENYWVAVEGDTPKLKYFTNESEALDLTNVVRKFDDSWFDKTKSEYVLTTNEQLYGFSLIATMRNETFSGKTIKLGANLTLNTGKASEWGEKAPAIEWLPVGKFHGTFDGQGHTVSGLYLDSAETYQGMFGSTQSGAVIKNFSLKNSFFRVTNDTLGANVLGLGSVIGNMADATLENVYSNAIVINAGEGGIGTGGLVGNVSISQKNEIINCWFDGYVESAWRGNAGIIGYVSNGKLNILHCLNTGDIYKKYNNTASRSGNFVGDITGWSVNTMVTIEDSMAVGVITTDNPNQVGSVVGYMTGNPNKEKTAVLKGNNVFVANECYKRTTGTIAKGATMELTPCVMSETEWIGYDGYIKTTLDFANYWAVKTDSTPILKNFASKVPSLAGVKRWDTTWYDESKTTFVLKDKYDLCGFALLTASGVNFEGKTVTLGNNITVNSGNAEDWATNPPAENWLAIQKFAGTFDGKGYTISGVYLKNEQASQGLFGSTTKTSVVKNFKLTNSYFEANAVGIASNGTNALGSVIGSASGTLEDVYSDAIVVNTTAKGEAGTGGLIGYGSDIKIIGCWFDGAVTSEWRGNAGIIGYVSNSTALIKNCLNSGTVHQTIKTQPARTAGILGEVLEWSVETVVTIEDCLNVGKITHVNQNQVGAIVGYTSGNKNKNAYPVVTGSNVYKTAESHSRASGATIEMVVTNMKEADLTGYNGYIKTTLDFENYWAVDLNGTPILKKFASTVPSLAGIERYDISWYDDSKTSFVISTPAEFNGFSLLTSMGKTFAGKTVTLGDNIELNKNTPTKASEWETYLKTNTPNTWMPIVGFAGTFDGNGKEISGVYVDGGDKQQGLFGSTTKTAVVKNFELVNSYFTTYVPGIASNDAVSLGSVAGLGLGTFKHIYSNAVVINTTQRGNGGTGGLVGSVSGAHTEVNDCWFDGEVTSNWNGIGGIVGYVSNTTVDVLHCLNSGTINQTISTQPARTGGIVGYVLEWSVETEVKIEDTLNVGEVICVNPNQSGSISGFTYGNPNTGVKPVISGSNVYATGESHGRTSGSGIALKPTVVSAATINGYGAYKWTDLDFENCWAVVLDGTPILKAFAEEVPDLTKVIKPDISWYSDEGTTFEIRTAAELEGLSVLASQGKTFAGKTVILKDHIEYNEGKAADWDETAPTNVWVPIQNFAGIFDGNGKEISGIYLKTTQTEQGLFGKTAETSVIKNFSLLNSYFEASVPASSLSQTYSSISLGSVVGYAFGDVKDIYSEAIVVNSGGVGTGTGGIVGGVSGVDGVQISNCWFAGSVTTNWSGAAGILGYISNGKVDVLHCLNTGTISQTTAGAPARVGGLVGYSVAWSRDTIINIEDSLNTGTVTHVNPNQAGSIMGFAEKNSNGKVAFDVTGTNAYATSQSHNGAEGIALDISIVPKIVSADEIQGYNGYVYTVLDFVNYWAVDLDGTPVLQDFADEIPSLAGYSIRKDKAWYNTTDTTFTLYTKEELYGLQEIVASGEFGTKTIKLGADIVVNANTPSTKEGWNTYLTSNTPVEWVPIGDATNKFAGNFNGQGHTISGVYYDGAAAVNGLFGQTASGSTLKNFRLENSYFKTSTGQMGSIAGWAAGTIEGVYSNAVVISTNTGYSHNGGFVGFANGGTTRISDCWFAGTIDAAGGRIGGFVGTVNCNFTLEHCLNTSSMVNDYAGSEYRGGLIGYTQSNASQTYNISDNLEASTKTINTGATARWGAAIGYCGANGTHTGSDNYVLSNKANKEAVTLSLMASGSLDGCVIEDITGKSILGELAKENASGLDYAGHWVTVKDKIPTLKVFTIDIKWYDDSKTEFTLTTPEQLLGFAQLSQSNTFANKTIKLGANIELNKNTPSTKADWETYLTSNTPTKWTTIGNDTSKFAGVFDGQGYTISGVYYDGAAAVNGLFGQMAPGSFVQNFRLENSYFKTSAGQIGSIAGWAAGTIQQVYSNAVVISTNTGYCHNGGLVGFANGGTTVISDCWFAGTLETQAGRNGGFVGTVNCNFTLQHCLNTGMVINDYVAANADYSGGFFGWSQNNSLDINISDCLDASTKTINVAATKWGAAVGYAGWNARHTGSGNYVLSNKANNGAITLKILNAASLDSCVITDITGQSIKGDLAKTNASGLDYTNHWETVEDGHPIPKLVPKKK